MLDRTAGLIPLFMPVSWVRYWLFAWPFAKIRSEEGEGSYWPSKRPIADPTYRQLSI